MTVEINPASDLCQRWTAGTHTWRHKHDGGFNPDHYEVREIVEAVAEPYVLANHYSSSYPSAKLRYGLYAAGELVGVAVLGIPVQAAVLTNPFPDLEPYVESVELSRLVLADAVPGNGESWFLGQLFNLAAERGIRGVVSFADPVPRVIDGRILFPGHIGTIYQATNAVYAGRATARTLVLLPDGEVLNERSQQKVRSQQRGHRYVEEKLVALGAPVPRAGEHPGQWLTAAIETAGGRRMRHHGNHRYLFRLGTTARQRRQVRIALPGQAYPKVRDAA